MNAALGPVTMDESVYSTIQFKIPNEKVKYLRVVKGEMENAELERVRMRVAFSLVTSELYRDRVGSGAFFLSALEMVLPGMLTNIIGSYNVCDFSAVDTPEGMNSLVKCGVH